MDRHISHPAGLLVAAALATWLPAGVMAGDPASLSGSATAAPTATPTPRAHIESSGYATILHAPPSARPVERMKRYEPEEVRLVREMGITPEDARRRVDVDAQTRRDADALDERLESGAVSNYVGSRIVRDPYARVEFHFRSDAAATLARFTTDPRFVAVEGGIPRDELEPLFQLWWSRLSAHRVATMGSITEFEGGVEFGLNIERGRFEAIAKEEGWTVPANVRLRFKAPQNPRSVDPRLAPLVRVFAREERPPGVVNAAGLRGRLILRDGCFRIQQHVEGEPLALFERDLELGLDDEGYLVILRATSIQDDQGPARVGEIVTWAGPRGFQEDDAGVASLRAACGGDPVVAVGAPQSEREFNLRYPPE